MLLRLRLEIGLLAIQGMSTVTRLSLGRDRELGHIAFAAHEIA